MPENYLTLSREERLEALGVAATQSGRPVHLLEKDIWVVWAVDGLFSSEFGEHLVFKGGTSLSKGYDVIDRFSEDIDITYDIRQLVPELAADDPIPKSNSQADKWTREINEKLAVWVKEKALPVIEKHINATSLGVKAIVDGTKIYIDYDPLAKGTGYVPPRVTLEFGARSTGEPSERRTITCDAAAYLTDLQFPIRDAEHYAPEAELLGEGDRRSCVLRTAATKGIAIPAIGMTWCGWTTPALQRPHSMTQILPRKSRPSKDGSSARRIAAAIRLTIRKPCRAN